MDYDLLGDNLNPNLPLWYVVRDLCSTDVCSPGNNVLALAGYTPPTRQRELDHTDHTDHTDLSALYGRDLHHEL